jgi:hypothetical protein
MRSLSRHFLHRSVAAALLAMCMMCVAQAGDSRQHAARAAAQQQMQRFSVEAALVDSSAFGQLRMLREVEARVVPAQPSVRASGESCR